MRSLCLLAILMITITGCSVSTPQKSLGKLVGSRDMHFKETWTEIAPNVVVVHAERHEESTGILRGPSTLPATD